MLYIQSRAEAFFGKDKKELGRISRGHLECFKPILWLFEDLQKLWGAETLWVVMTSYVIMHNMIVEDEGDGVCHGLDFQYVRDPIRLPEQNPMTFEDFI